MKKYIGTKTIMAKPMAKSEAEKELNRSLADAKGGEDGYLVEYPDGYKSWSPKETFEEAYKVADTPLDRMSIEENELADRMEKLAVSISGDKYKELDNATRAMLAAQYSSMSAYLHVLRLRSTKMESKDGGCSGISFGSAIALLKSGFAIRRSGWNGKNLFAIKQVPAHIESDIIPKMQSLPQSAKDLILNGKGFIDYTSQCLIYNGNTGRADSWVPSISDVFADDWELVE